MVSIIRKLDSSKREREKKQLKRQITNSFLKHKKLMKKIKKYDELIDHKISEFNINFIKEV